MNAQKRESISHLLAVAGMHTKHATSIAKMLLEYEKGDLTDTQIGRLDLIVKRLSVTDDMLAKLHGEIGAS